MTPSLLLTVQFAVTTHAEINSIRQAWLDKVAKKKKLSKLTCQQLKLDLYKAVIFEKIGV